MHPKSKGLAIICSVMSCIDVGDKSLKRTESAHWIQLNNYQVDFSSFLKHFLYSHFCPSEGLNHNGHLLRLQSVHRCLHEQHTNAAKVYILNKDWKKGTKCQLGGNKVSIKKAGICGHVVSLWFHLYTKLNKHRFYRVPQLAVCCIYGWQYYLYNLGH